MLWNFGWGLLRTRTQVFIVLFSSSPGLGSEHTYACDYQVYFVQTIDSLQSSGAHEQYAIN